MQLERAQHLKISHCGLVKTGSSGRSGQRMPIPMVGLTSSTATGAQRHNKLENQDMTTYTCPECGSDQVTTAHIQKFMVNSGDHWCHSVKTHDSYSPADCLDCDWTGVRSDLTEVEQPKKTKKAKK